MKGVILAAGKGTRMLPLTERRPKPLVPVLDRPMIEHIIIGARDAGVDHIALVIGHLGDLIRETFGDGSRLGVKLEYIWQEHAGGTGAATLLARDFIGEDPFFLSWGDIIVAPETYANVMAAWEQDRPDAVLSLNWVEDPWEGAAVYVEEGYVEKIVEKPPKGTATTHFNNAGIFVFGPELVHILESTPASARGEVEVPDAIQTMLSRGRRIRGLEVVGYWSDVARPGTVIELNSRIVAFRQPDGLLIAPDATVDPAAMLQPPVFIGPGCVVGKATIGPDVALAADVSIADGTTVQQSAIFARARLGEGASVQLAVVEECAEVQGLAVTGSGGCPAVIRRR